jgi:hypothetical protein
MKKTIITLLAAALCVVSASAQDDQRDKGTETKKGYNILPAAGDFAIGVDATPFLEYGIGLFSGANAPTFTGYEGNIYGKYFLQDNQALRFGLNLNFRGTLDRYKVRDDAETMSNPLNPDATTFDTRNVTNSGFGLFAGYEWRRGYGRLQAFFGGDAGFGVYTQKITYKYGNPITDLNQRPTSATWLGGAANLGTRPLYTKGSNAFSLMARGIAGVEYFFARKMSLGGQVGIGFDYSNSGQGLTTTETYNAAKSQIEEKTLRDGTNGGQRSWELDTNLSGNIFLMFHF